MPDIENRASLDELTGEGELSDDALNNVSGGTQSIGFPGNAASTQSISIGFPGNAA